MNMKFKIGFTIDGETLFGMLSKMLPIESLSVEEIVPKPTLAERAIAVNRLTQQADSRRCARRPTTSANRLARA